MTETITVSDWLSKHHTHEILDNDISRRNFEEETGELAPWNHSHTAEELHNMRPCELTDNNPNIRHISLLEIAEACTKKYVPHPWHHGRYGMGFAVRACISELKKYNF